MTSEAIPADFGNVLTLALRQLPAEALACLSGEETLALHGQIRYILCFHGGTIR